VENNVTEVRGGSVVQNNEATVNGGFLHADKSFVHVEHYDLVNNRATRGGVVSLLSSNFSLFGRSNTSRSRMIIRNNTALEYGGAMFVSSSNVTMGTRSDSNPIMIEHNIASRDRGGFLFGIDSTIMIYGSNFSKNQAAIGGAFFIDRSSITLAGSSDPKNPILVENNIALGGGFLYGWNGSSFNATMGNFVFRNNTAMVR
jgi:hypothetical protein